MDHLLIDAALIGLAGWRIANMLVDEDGPSQIFERIRNFVGVKPGEISGFLPSIFSCIFCMSVWTTFGAYLVYLLSTTAVMIGAAMAIALIANKMASLGDR